MDTRNIWQTVLADLELQLTKVVYQTLISQTSLESLTENEAVINCANPMLINIIEKRYQEVIKKTLEQYTQKELSLVFQPKKNGKINHIDGPLFTHKMQPIRDAFSSDNQQLNNTYTFENFAVSSSNQMAYAAATAVAKNPGNAYNPLFLYGGTGVGKTHLMQAIGQQVFTQNRKTKILACTGEEFTNEMIEALSTKTTPAFKRKYRKVDLLLIDDIQFIAGKYSIQEEFFHTFNSVYQAKKQIVITSDRPGEEIEKLEERLRSRFEGGLTIDIGSPDFELRTAILLIKAKQRNIVLPIESAKLLAANIDNTRKLEGVFIRVISEANTRGVAIDDTLIKTVLGKTLKASVPVKKVTMEAVMKVVTDYYRLKISQLRSDKRDKVYSLPRQILYYLLRIEAGFNLTQIGEFLGGRDHTTILHGVRKISKLLSTNEDIREDILGIKKTIFS